MTALRALTGPVRAVHTVRTLARGAVTNAHRALVEVQRAVLDRQELSADLCAPAAPGRLQSLDEPTCWSLIASQQVGRLAYVARVGTPDVAPVNYAVDGRELLVRSGSGPKLQAAERRERVVLEVDSFDAADRSGWSVLVHGRAELVRLGDHLETEPDTWATGPRRHVLRIVPERVTGRRLNGGPSGRA